MKESNDTKDQKTDVLETTPAPMPTQAKKREEVINFDSWFTVKCAAKRRVFPHHYETIKAYFNKQGLNETETASTFDSALKVFGF